MSNRPNIVLVHGAWADGSSWAGVIQHLQAEGYQVTAPQFPLTSLADDVTRLRQVLDLQDGPTIVAGHSYGGQVVTALGTDAPNVVGLVYVNEAIPPDAQRQFAGRMGATTTELPASHLALVSHPDDVARLIMTAAEARTAATAAIGWTG